MLARTSVAIFAEYYAIGPSCFPADLLHSAAWLQGINFAVSLFCFCLLFRADLYRFVPDAPMALGRRLGWSAFNLDPLLAIRKSLRESSYVNYAAFASGAMAPPVPCFVNFCFPSMSARIFLFLAASSRARLFRTLWLSVAAYPTKILMTRIWIRWGSFLYADRASMATAAFGAQCAQKHACPIR